MENTFEDLTVDELLLKIKSLNTNIVALEQTRQECVSELQRRIPNCAGIEFYD